MDAEGESEGQQHFSRGASIDSNHPSQVEVGSSMPPRSSTLEPEEGSSKGSKTGRGSTGPSSKKRGTKRKQGSEVPTPSPSVPPQDLDHQICKAPTLIPTEYKACEKEELYMTRGYPPNKFGFRYRPCGLATREYKTPTGDIYRCVESEPARVARFSWEDRSPYVFISRDGSIVSTDKGFRSARVNVPLREGTSYFEIYIEKGGGDAADSKLDAAHVRVGIGRRESSLNAPVGMDAFSYGLRDKTGDKVHISQPEPYGEPFKTGDVIGVLVDLPPRIRHENIDPENPSSIVLHKRVAIRYKNETFFESVEYIPAPEMIRLVDEAAEARLPPQKQVKQKAAAPGMKHRPLPSENAPAPRELPKLPGSAVYFFKNGKPMSHEPAFTDLFDFLPLKPHPPQPDATKKSKKQKAPDLLADRENHNDDGTLGYYPVVSCYGGAMARLCASRPFYAPPDMSYFGNSEDPEKQRLVHYVSLQERYLEYVDQIRFLDDKEVERLIALHYGPAELESASATPKPQLDPTADTDSRNASLAPSSPMLKPSPIPATGKLDAPTPVERPISPLVPVKTEEEVWQEQQQQEQQLEGPEPVLKEASQVQETEMPELNGQEAPEPLLATDQDAPGESDTDMF